jgi:heme-degrading monooxygenase HmoA
VYAIFWEYEVRREQVAAFEALYGADGGWARLFRRAEGYVETRLFRDVDRPMHYLTVDRWLSRAAYDAFVLASGSAYAALDRRSDALTVRERRLGSLDG